MPKRSLQPYADLLRLPRTRAKAAPSQFREKRRIGDVPVVNFSSCSGKFHVTGRSRYGLAGGFIRYRVARAVLDAT
jgi:hypothetical protein